VHIYEGLDRQCVINTSMYSASKINN